MSLIQNLCLLLITAHLLGRLASYWRQPELLGHMLAGIVLGPSILNWISNNSSLNAFADFAVLVVVILAGLEMRLRDISSMFTPRNLPALLPGIALPAISGFLLARYFGLSMVSAVVVALCIAVTALPVALRILGGFGLLGSPLAKLAIAGALLADVLVLLTLGMLRNTGNSLTATLEPSLTLAQLGAPLLWGLTRLAALLTLLAAGHWLNQWIYRRRALQPGRLAAARISYSLLLILGLAAASDALGLHFAVGAFLGALSVSDVSDGGHAATHPLRLQLEGMSTVLFAPLFLATQGTHFTLSGLMQPSFAVLLIVVAVLSKLVGGYWGARLHGLSPHAARGTAIVMNARGLMEMVVASIAYRAGLVDMALFSTLLLVGMITTLLTPTLLKLWQQQALSNTHSSVSDQQRNH